jgi:hypothetical protein
MQQLHTQPCLHNSLSVLKVQCFTSGSVSSLNNFWNREKKSYENIKFMCEKQSNLFLWNFIQMQNPTTNYE